MEVMYTFHANNGYFSFRPFIGFYGEVSDLEILIDNLDSVDLSRGNVKRYIKYDEELFSVLGVDKSILSKKVHDLSYSERKCVMLLASVMKKPKVIVLNYADVGFNYKDKSKLVKFIKLVNASLKINFVILSNDSIFVNKCCNHVIACNKGIIKFQGSVIEAIDNGYYDRPVIFDFIDKANKAGAKLEYTLNDKELLKAIYRSVF